MKRLRQIIKFRLDSTSTSAEKILFGTGLIISTVLLYEVHLGFLKQSESQTKYRKFRSLIKEYKLLSPSSQHKKTKKSLNTQPLTYLDEKLQETSIGRHHISSLTPMGNSKDGRRLFEIRLSATRIRKVFQLLRTLEMEDRMRVRQFYLERSSPSVPRLEATFELIIVSKVPQSSSKKKPQNGDAAPTVKNSQGEADQSIHRIIKNKDQE